jgi:hypothetical protein
MVKLSRAMNPIVSGVRSNRKRAPGAMSMPHHAELIVVQKL